MQHPARSALYGQMDVFTDILTKEMALFVNVKNSHEYRAFLQKNAENIMGDFAKCSEQPECKLCPVCKGAIEYKPGKQD